MAARYLEEGRPEDEAFHALFLDPRLVRYPHLYPGREVFPLTALSCKRFPGFRSGEDPTAPHGVEDRLFHRIAQVLGCKVDRDLSCSRCGEDLKGIAGWFTGTTRKGVHKTIQTHVGIDRSTRTSAQGILFSEEMISERRRSGEASPEGGDETASPLQTFEGRLLVAEELLDSLRALAERPLRLGRSRSRGKGRVTLSILEEEPAWNETEARKRWRAWSEAVTRFTGSKDFFFALTLHGGAIVIDPFLRPSSDPAAAVPWLPPIVPFGERSEVSFGASAKLEYLTSVSKMRVVRGWHAAHALPRTDDLAIEAGSVFAYRLVGGDDECIERLLDRLVYLAREGIGVRRNEGYGSLSISAPFHHDFFQGGPG
ncbi:MAG: hypothetical protein D6795_06855 [Deltaproteobacteria bacterium]|nr:MAG: hypothetical protein D6795_06855 [Deltaproteobacteria bacterium]